MSSIETWLRQYRQHNDNVDDDMQQKVDFMPPLHDYLLGRTSATDTAKKISSLLAGSIAAACAPSVNVADMRKDDKIVNEEVDDVGNDDDDDDAFDKDEEDDDVDGGDDLEAGLWDLWAIINDAAKQVPDVHDALLDLLAALRQLPNVKRDDGELLRVWDMVLWRDLPIWGADVREKYNCKFSPCPHIVFLPSMVFEPLCHFLYGYAMRAHVSASSCRFNICHVFSVSLPAAVGPYDSPPLGVGGSLKISRCARRISYTPMLLVVLAKNYG
jgi:hypothetical protein